MARKGSFTTSTAKIEKAITALAKTAADLQEILAGLGEDVPVSAFDRDQAFCHLGYLRDGLRHEVQQRQESMAILQQLRLQKAREAECRSDYAKGKWR